MEADVASNSKRRDRPTRHDNAASGRRVARRDFDRRSRSLNVRVCADLHFVQARRFCGSRWPRVSGNWVVGRERSYSLFSSSAEICADESALGEATHPFVSASLVSTWHGCRRREGALGTRAPYVVGLNLFSLWAGAPSRFLGEAVAACSPRTREPITRLGRVAGGGGRGSPGQ